MGAISAEAEDGQDSADDADEPENISPDAAFDAFLEEAIVRRTGGGLTTAHIRTVWTARYGADPEGDIIAGIRKHGVAKRFRKRFSAPPGTRGRAGRKVERYWDGYTIDQNIAGMKCQGWRDIGPSGC